MGEILELEESDFAGYIDEGEIFRAEVVGVRKIKKPFADEQGNDIFRMEFKFALDAPDTAFDGQNIWGDTGITFNTNPNCKLRNWAQEILGAELPPGFKLDTDSLVGMPVRVMVGLKKYTKKGETQERQHNFVSDVMRVGDVSLNDEEPF